MSVVPVVETEFTPPQSEFSAMLEDRWSQGHFLCVGLDTDFGRLPVEVVDKTEFHGEALVLFNLNVVDAVQHVACAIKPNLGFYLAEGPDGLQALIDTVAYIHTRHQGIPVILDGKFGDIGPSMQQYARLAFDIVKADAATVSPYLGSDALEPFLLRTNKGIIIIDKTSNPGSGELQDRHVLPDDISLYEYLAGRIKDSWNINGNCGLVVGANYPGALQGVRRIVGGLPILVPALGKQGGKAEDLVGSFDSRGHGIIANNSSDIIFAKKEPGENWLDAVARRAETWHDALYQAHLSHLDQ